MQLVKRAWASILHPGQTTVCWSLAPGPTCAPGPTALATTSALGSIWAAGWIRGGGEGMAIFYP